MAYEQRLAALEKELALAEGKKRDLIRAKIVLARRNTRKNGPKPGRAQLGFIHRGKQIEICFFPCAVSI